MKKLLAMTAVAGLMSIAAPSSANAAYLFAFPASEGVQTLTINGTTVIQADQTGWFNSSGGHSSGNTNYLVGQFAGQQYNNFFGFDLSEISGIITSAVLDIGNGPFGLSGEPVTWTTYDVDGAIDTNISYSNVGIFTDLGSGTSYGAVVVAAPTNNVSLALNASGLTAVNNSVGRSFFVGGTLTPLVAAVPEPVTWLMMILGFAAIGGVMRRKDSVTTRVRFA